jgi:serine/threonine protein kinase
VKLADLGFSLRTCAQASLENTFAPMVVSSHSESKLDLSVSRYSGSLMNGGGTIGFMAPETTFTLASDIYSFGITCVVIVLQCNVNGVQDALRRAARWWNQQTNDEAAIQLIERCLARSQHERPTAQQCVGSFERIIQNNMRWNYDEHATSELKEVIQSFVN